MNKSQLIDVLSQKLEIPKNQVELFLDTTIETIQNTVAEGEEIKLVGFGTFSRKKRKAKKGRNPKTGQEVEIPGVTIPHFKPGKEFKDSVK